MRYLFLLLLAGCTASTWTKDGTTTADQDKDYEDCRQVTKPDPAIAAAFGVFGAVGVFLGVSYNDSKIRSCMEGRGWSRNGEVAQPSQGTQPIQASQPAQAPQPVQAMQPVQGTQPVQERQSSQNF